MSIRLIIEAMDAVDLGLTWRERVVLMVLAETARDDTRLCWPGYEGDDERARAFRRRVDCSRTQFYATVAALVSKGALEVAEHGHKGQRAGYRVLPPQSSRPPQSVPQTGTLSDPEASRKPGPINGSKGPGLEAKGSRFTSQRVPETGTPSLLIPQGSLNLSPVLAVVRAAEVVAESEEREFADWADKAYGRGKPLAPAWWRACARNGDLSKLAVDWRKIRRGESQPATYAPLGPTPADVVAAAEHADYAAARTALHTGRRNP